MGERPLGAVLKAALVAGVVAGLAVAVFHLAITEPVIDRAILLEGELSAAGGTHEEPLVGRTVQKAGLVVGFLLYGLTWALLLALVYQLAQPWLARWSPLKRAVLLALAGYWAVGLFPLVKYPANPPGVGDPETIAYRQGLYLGLLALAIGGVMAAALLGRSVARRMPGRRGGAWLAALAFLAAFSALVYLAMPGTPDEVRMPADLVASFRALSIAGVTLFWAVLGLTFGLLLGDEGRGPVWAPRRA